MEPNYNIPNPDSNLTQLENYISRLIRKNNPPGLSTVAVKNRGVVYAKSFGSADGPNQVPVSNDTVYHWWSMTKIPTAIAIMQLHEQELLHIDDPVVGYLPYFQVESKNPEAGQITIRQLLAHTSGLPDTIPAMIGWVHFDEVIYNQTEMLKRHLPDYNRLHFDPGIGSSYSNLGYLVLGALIEAVTVGSYEDYILENVLKPTGMGNTGFLYTNDMGEHEAIGSHPLLSIYTPMLPFLMDMKAVVRERERLALWFNRLYLDVTPSSGLIGSANDLARLMNAYLNPSVLLSEKSKDMMLPSGDLPSERALGWAQYSLNGRLWVQHRGGGPGFATIMRLYPEESLGLAILANGTNLKSERFIELLADINWE